MSSFILPVAFMTANKVGDRSYILHNSIKPGRNLILFKDFFTLKYNFFASFAVTFDVNRNQPLRVYYDYALRTFSSVLGSIKLKF